MSVHIVKSLARMAVVVTCFGVIACDNSEFKATGGAAGTGPNTGLPNPNGPGLGNGSELSSPNVGDNALGQQGGLSSDQGCISNSGTRYNIVFVFDQSGSQNRTDPERIRGAAAASFVQRMTDPRRVRGEVYINMLGFNDSATPGPGGWTKLEPNSVAVIQNNIMQTTPPPPPFEGTHYGPALIAAQQMLSQFSGQTTGRNLVVFLTDGKPSDEDEYPAALQQLITTSRATMITVASGSGVEADGEQVVQSMAMPTSTQGNQMAGIYQRARQASDLGSAFDRIFQAITECPGSNAGTSTNGSGINSGSIIQ
jgi:hypothetical protein